MVKYFPSLKTKFDCRIHLGTVASGEAKWSPMRRWLGDGQSCGTVGKVATYNICIPIFMLLANAPGESAEDDGASAPAIHVGDQDDISGSRLQYGSALAAAAIRELNPQVGDTSYVCLPLPFKKIYIIYIGGEKTIYRR